MVASSPRERTRQSECTCSEKVLQNPVLKFDYSSESSSVEDDYLEDSSSEDEDAIPFKQHHRFLGIIWDTKLTFQKHVAYIKIEKK